MHRTTQVCTTLAECDESIAIDAHEEAGIARTWVVEDHAATNIQGTGVRYSDFREGLLAWLLKETQRGHCQIRPESGTGHQNKRLREFPTSHKVIIGPRNRKIFLPRRRIRHKLLL
jgi:hypothetical protein